MMAIARPPAYHPTVADQTTATSHGWFTRLIRTLLEWRERARERRDLIAMDQRMLKDIGLTKVDAWREANKPVWRR